MAGFSIAEGTARTLWIPVDYNGTVLYVGQLVVAGGVLSALCGAAKAWACAGVGDITTDHLIMGVVVGTNNKEPVFNSTYKAEYITGVQSQANLVARKSAYVGGAGMYGPSDPQAMVKVALIDNTTVLKGRIFNATYGVAPTVVTVTTESTTGAGFTSGAVEHTPVAYNATVYCRTGANRGLYRVTTDTSTTVRTTNHYFPYDIAVGDTFVGCNLPTVGQAYMMVDSVGTFIDNAAAVTTTNYSWIDVLELNLETAGAEYCLFRFNPYQFLSKRA